MAPLHLAVDAQALVGREQTGIGVYSNNILGGIATLDLENHYYLPYFWSPRRRLPYRPPLPPNFAYRRVPLPMPVVQALEQRGVSLRWDRFYRSLNACLFTAGSARPLRRGGNVRVIHDIAYLTHPETLPSQSTADAWAHNIRSTLPAMDAVIVTSEATRREVHETLGVAIDTILVAPPAADRDVFYPRSIDEVASARRKYGIGGDYVLHTGMQQPRKNIPRLIASVSQLPAAQCQDVMLVLAGPASWGSTEIALAAQAASTLGVVVKQLGFVPSNDLAALYSGAAAFAFPSLYEGFGMPVLEAMACGAPVVTGTGPALREVANGAAIHVDPTDIDAMSTAIQGVIDDSEQRNSLSQRSLERARAFSWLKSARVVHDELVRVARASA